MRNTWPTIENFSRIIASLRGEIYYSSAEVNQLMPSVACGGCGEVPDRFSRCGCDY